MGTVLSTITVPSTVGGVSAGVSAASILGAARTVNLAGLQSGDTLDLQGANEDTSAKYALVKRFTYGGSVAQEITLLPSENSQYYRVKRVALATGNAGTGRTVVIAGDLGLDLGLDGSNTPLVTDVWTNPVASNAAGLKASVTNSVSAVTVLAAALTSGAGGTGALSTYPRNVTFTVGVSTNGPASVVITGTDINDNALSETVSSLNTIALHQGVKAFKTIVSLVFAGASVADGTTITIGFGKVFGLSAPVKNRAGTTAATCNVLQEIFADLGHSGTGITGTFNTVALGAPNGTYSPASAPNGALDYAVTYERV